MSFNTPLGATSWLPDILILGTESNILARETGPDCGDPDDGWDPDDCWDPDFDRVSSTAALYAGMGDLTLCLCALCLLRYRIGFRYPSIYI